MAQAEPEIDGHFGGFPNPQAAIMSAFARRHTPPTTLLLLASLASGALPSVALAETCSERAGLCDDACTPALVDSGAQAGGTIAGCHASCQARLRSCLKTGVWVHMGAQHRGLQQRVDRK